MRDDASGCLSPAGHSQHQIAHSPFTCYLNPLARWPEARVGRDAVAGGYYPVVSAQSNQRRNQAQRASKQGQGPPGLHEHSSGFPLLRIKTQMTQTVGS